MAAKLKITYLDGEVVEVLATPRAQVETERALRQQGGMNGATVVEASFRLGYESLRSRKQLRDDGVDYESWLNTLDDVEELENRPADPTPPGESPTPSFD